MSILTPGRSPSTSSVVAHAHDSRDDLIAAEIPAADILAGAPASRCAHLAFPGEGMAVWLWDCTAGRFAWHFEGDEVVHIVEGSVTVTDHLGGVVHLGVGDVATFARGTTAVWDVEQYVKKVAVTRNLPKDPASRLVRFARRVGRRLKPE